MFVNRSRFSRLGRRAANGRRRAYRDSRRSRPVFETLERRVVLSSFEVWALDQSNTRDENANGSILDTVDSGGTLYIYALTILLLLLRPQGLFGRAA